MHGAAPEAGRLVAGRYRLAERIGRGGMGTVWRAEDELLARQVAVKRLHVNPGLEEDELATLYERTRREARSAARIAHPNVVVVHDVVEDGGLPCIVMEYVPSTTLGDVLKRGPIGPEEAARIGRGMTAALRAAHAAGVLHRDVKPGNVLLGHDGRVVLTDFGIAQSTGTSTLTKTGEMVGSIDYIAPERVKGGKPGPASDLWALGATLYQALEGRPPFRRDTAVETAYAIAMDPLAPPRQAGPLTKLIETLLAKDPALRPPAELVEQILREPAAEAATAAHRTPHGLATPPAPRPAPPAVTPTPTPVPAPDATTTAPAAAPMAVPATGPTVAATTVAPSPTPVTPSAPPAPAAAPAKPRRRAARWWWAAAATVVAGALAAGAYLLTRDGDEESRAERPDTTPTPAPAHSSTTPAPKPPPTYPPLPKGYHLVEEKQLGVSFPVPDGWTRQEKSSREVDYIDRTGLVGLKINVLDFAGRDHVQHWKDVEQQLKASPEIRNYHRGRLQETTFRDEPAAIWEFTWSGRARDFQAVDLGFGREGGAEYAIYLSAPKADWERHRPVFDVVRDGFRTGERP
ncbi:serine/threonine-protein kinase [Streptomyces abikoensis]|uniref:serine/threonine-protein kinase n=1 Tax=Streptomyces TaxID=1883 RepID=UPI0023EA6707|nr:serine/threonine-protein kinase [Streptomyces luteoverticillatus]